mgnify:CR=1 FL=1
MLFRSIWFPMERAASGLLSSSFSNTSRPVFVVARPASANLLDQPGVASYVNKIEVAGKSKETVNFNETTLNPLQVMNFVRGLVTQHPEFAQTIVEIAQTGGSSSPR